MAELTPQDRENYEKLQKAFQKLNDGIVFTSPIKNITDSVNKVLNPVLKSLINDTGELRKKVDLVDGYLTIQALLIPNDSAVVQEIANLNEALKRSLKVVEDETIDLTDEIESFCSDSLFFKSLDAPFKQLTEALLNDRSPDLNETNINPLIQAWGKAVQKFVDDARKKGEQNGKVTPGEPETFASFFCIHNQLETLYSRLADTETVQRSR
jgi:hypothetical protein